MFFCLAYWSSVAMAQQEACACQLSYDVQCLDDSITIEIKNCGNDTCYLFDTYLQDMNYQSLTLFCIYH